MKNRQKKIIFLFVIVFIRFPQKPRNALFHRYLWKLIKNKSFIQRERIIWFIPKKKFQEIENNWLIINV